MKAEMAKEKPNDEEFGFGPCVNPTAGEARVESYIAGKLTEAENQDFVNHVAQCKYCLQEVVLWRMAEELVEREHRPEQVIQNA